MITVAGFKRVRDPAARPELLTVLERDDAVWACPLDGLAPGDASVLITNKPIETGRVGLRLPSFEFGCLDAPTDVMSVALSDSLYYLNVEDGSPGYVAFGKAQHYQEFLDYLEDGPGAPPRDHDLGFEGNYAALAVTGAGLSFTLVLVYRINFDALDGSACCDAISIDYLDHTCGRADRRYVVRPVRQPCHNLSCSFESTAQYVETVQTSVMPITALDNLRESDPLSKADATIGEDIDMEDVKQDPELPPLLVTAERVLDFDAHFLCIDCYAHTLGVALGRSAVCVRQRHAPGG